MPFLLDVLYVALVVASAPVLLLRSWRSGKYRDGWRQKLLGKAPRRISDRPCLWFHAVSVGEVQLLRPLIAILARRRPDWDVVISTTTVSGLAVARRRFPDLVTFYAPLDFSWSVRRALARVRPTALVLVELELWPNLIRAAKDSGAAVTIINGRLSDRSHAGYRRIARLLRPTLQRLDAVAAQSKTSADRFIDLGVPARRVQVTGSVKYDGLEQDRQNPRTLALRRELALDPADIVFVAGSTMEGEESAALEAYQLARRHHPRLRLVIVPRHAERFERVASWLEQRGEQVLRRSIGSPPPNAPNAAPPIVLVDTIGELSAVWGLADLAFVGGSLFPGRGGQNMMEPAAYGASVLFGPYTSNFREAVEGLLDRGGARRVNDARDLTAALLADLADPETADARADAGRAFVLTQNGAADRTVALLDRLIEQRRRSEVGGTLRSSSIREATVPTSIGS
ncbi:3-deoxy-D-manno-octulosonic acid transferase [soil metagenome]